MNDCYVLPSLPKPINKMFCLMKDDKQLTVDEYPQHKYNGQISVEARLYFLWVISKSVTAG